MSKTTVVKEHPILFSGGMVKAILERRKTQTRRVVKGKPGPMDIRLVDGDDDTKGREIYLGGGVWGSLKCPYGKPGDRLWVKETWRTVKTDEVETLYFKADEEYHEGAGWKSPRFMPRWASRINLEITDVRVERVQDISASDVLAEGVEDHYPGSQDSIGEGDWKSCLVMQYEELWDSINGKKYPWKSNPWVWVVSFKVIK